MTKHVKCAIIYPSPGRLTQSLFIQEISLSLSQEFNMNTFFKVVFAIFALGFMSGASANTRDCGYGISVQGNTPCPIMMPNGQGGWYPATQGQTSVVPSSTSTGGCVSVGSTSGLLRSNGCFYEQSTAGYPANFYSPHVQGHCWVVDGGLLCRPQHISFTQSYSGSRAATSGNCHVLRDTALGAAVGAGVNHRDRIVGTLVGGLVGLVVGQSDCDPVQIAQEATKKGLCEGDTRPVKLNKPNHKQHGDWVCLPNDVANKPDDEGQPSARREPQGSSTPSAVRNQCSHKNNCPGKVAVIRANGDAACRPANADAEPGEKICS